MADQYPASGLTPNLKMTLEGIAVGIATNFLELDSLFPNGPTPSGYLLLTGGTIAGKLGIVPAGTVGTSPVDAIDILLPPIGADSYLKITAPGLTYSLRAGSASLNQYDIMANMIRDAVGNTYADDPTHVGLQFAISPEGNLHNSEFWFAVNPVGGNGSDIVFLVTGDGVVGIPGTSSGPSTPNGGVFGWSNIYPVDYDQLDTYLCRLSPGVIGIGASIGSYNGFDGSLKLTNLTVAGSFTDNLSSTGSLGQVLSSTVTGIKWVAAPSLISAAWATLYGDLTENQVIPWDGPTLGIPDTGISRISAHTLAFGNGSAGDYSGHLQAAVFTDGAGTYLSGGTIRLGNGAGQINISGSQILYGGGNGYGNTGHLFYIDGVGEVFSVLSTGIVLLPLTPPTSAHTAGTQGQLTSGTDGNLYFCSISGPGGGATTWNKLSMTAV
jgi:hypothetical protein